MALFLSYVSEAVPFRFASKAIVYQMRSLGLSPAAVGAFAWPVEDEAPGAGFPVVIGAKEEVA